jgi:hypothetical protein
MHPPTQNNDTVVTVITGRNCVTDPFAGIVLAIGNFSFAFDSSGNLVQPLQGTGKLVPLCQLIS